MKVMIVEDEQEIREILMELLENEGFQVIALDNAVDLLGEIDRNAPDLLLLDQILPGKNGVQAVQEVRGSQNHAKIPIIMVTGLSGEEDKVHALNHGADDYVTKPFYPKELAARIKALARRAELHEQEKPAQERIVRDDLTLDFTAHRVTVAGGEVGLTLTEFKILGELLKQCGQVLNRERLRERALGNLNVTDRTIDVHMASLRKKLGSVGDKIETVRGVGYRFAT